MIRVAIFIIFFTVPFFAISQDFTIEITDETPCTGDTVRVSHPDDTSCNWTIPEDDFEVTDGNPAGSSTLLLHCLNAGEFTITATAGSSTDSGIITVSEVTAGLKTVTGSFNTHRVDVYSDSLSGIYIFPLKFIWDFGDQTVITDSITTETNDSLYYSTETHTYDRDLQDSIVDITLTVTNGAGCSDMATATDTIHTVFKAPNVFTPNDDGINDHFTARTNGHIEFSMTIFSRWGNIVFQTERPTTRVVWNGRLKGGNRVSSGVYYYVIIPEDETNEEKLTGFVHVFTEKNK